MKNCAQCGGDMGGRVSTAVYCFSCIDQRRKIKKSPVPYQGSLKRMKIDGVYVCIDCKVKTERSFIRSRNVRMRCIPCGIKHTMRKRKIKSAAHRAVANAIKAGILKPAKDCICVDCGGQAQCYDHRFYSKPLDVVPVCRACNVCRGPTQDLAELMKAA